MPGLLLRPTYRFLWECWVVRISHCEILNNGVTIHRFIEMPVPGIFFCMVCDGLYAGPRLIGSDMTKAVRMESLLNFYKYPLGVCTFSAFAFKIKRIRVKIHFRYFKERVLCWN